MHLFHFTSSRDAPPEGGIKLPLIGFLHLALETQLLESLLAIVPTECRALHDNVEVNHKVRPWEGAVCLLTPGERESLGNRVCHTTVEITIHDKCHTSLQISKHGFTKGE